MELSSKAKSALIDANHRGQGAKVTTGIDAEWELVDGKLIGPGGGLTRAGTIARERATDALLDELF